MTKADHDDLVRIASLSGLESDLLRSPGITRWLDRRARTLGLDEKSHRAMLMQSEEERRILSEQVAVPESWIGRYPVSFDLLRERAHAEKWNSSVFRVLSLGCAAGQEPFSAAACILDAGVPAAKIEVVAVDRSRSAIEMGMNGDLPAMAVRGELPIYMRHRLERSGRRWKVGDELRSLVTFVEADVVSQSIPIEPESCHVVFCRNVLIYLESDARDRLSRRAASYLRENGVFFSGHADPPHDLRKTLAPLDRPGAFAWCRRSDETIRIPHESPPTVASRPMPIRTERRPLKKASAPEVTPVVSLASPTEVEEIHRVADFGRLSEARGLAEGLLALHPADPSVILILATIDSADGRVEAARDHLRRALYLNPDNLSALFQMAVLCESEGELELGARFRRRMDRIDSDGGLEE